MEIAWHGAPSPGFSRIQALHFCTASAWAAGGLGSGAAHAARTAPAAISKCRLRSASKLGEPGNTKQSSLAVTPGGWASCEERCNREPRRARFRYPRQVIVQGTALHGS